jgi:hypothetical protein
LKSTPVDNWRSVKKGNLFNAAMGLVSRANPLLFEDFSLRAGLEYPTLTTVAL